jgi:hypothetical protein
MNHDPPNLRHLLAELVPPSGNCCGPGRAAILEMARHERARRRQKRLIVSASAAALLALVLLWPSAPRQEPTLPATPVASSHIVIDQVDDRQLLALLKDTPVALMEWPDGQRTLLVMER